MKSPQKKLKPTKAPVAKKKRCLLNSDKLADVDDDLSEASTIVLNHTSDTSDNLKSTDDVPVPSCKS